MAFRFASYIDPAKQAEMKDEYMIKVEERRKPKAPIPCDGCSHIERLFDNDFCAKGNKMTRCAQYKFSGDQA